MRPTQLEAECILRADFEASKTWGEDWAFHVRYTYKVFPDTAEGLDRAAAWIRAHDINQSGRVDRQALRSEWRLFKRGYQYEDTGDIYHVYEAGGEWEYPRED